MKFIKKTFSVLAIMSFFIMTPVATVFAASDGTADVTKLKNPLGASGTDTIEGFLLVFTKKVSLLHYFLNEIPD